MSNSHCLYLKRYECKRDEEREGRVLSLRSRGVRDFQTSRIAKDVIIEASRGRWTDDTLMLIQGAGIARINSRDM